MGKIKNPLMMQSGDDSAAYIEKLTSGAISTSSFPSDGVYYFPHCNYYDSGVGPSWTYTARSKVQWTLSDRITVLTGRMMHDYNQLSSGQELWLKFDTSHVFNFFSSPPIDSSSDDLRHWCKGVYGTPLNFSAATNDTIIVCNGNNGDTTRKTGTFHIAVVANSIRTNFTLNIGDSDNSWKLEESSAVSLANGLDGTFSGKTLTVGTQDKAAFQTLMGTVTDGVFTADTSGTTSLSTFITVTKGWTLA